MIHRVTCHFPASRISLRLSGRTLANEDSSLRAFPVKDGVAIVWFQTCNMLADGSWLEPGFCMHSRRVGLSLAQGLETWLLEIYLEICRVVL